MAVAIDSDSATINSVNLTVQGSDPATPASGHAQLYVKSGHVYIRTDAGTVVDIGPLSAGSVATDAIWDAAGDLAVGSGANTAARLAIGTAYQFPRVNSGATSLEYVTGGLVRLAQTVVAGSAAASIDIQSLPAIYTTLILEYLAVSDQAAAQNLFVRFNNDSAGNYDWNYRGHDGTGTAGSDSFAQTGALVGAIPGTNAPSGTAAVGRIVIPYYARTDFHKAVFSDGFSKLANTATNIYRFTCSANWRATTAIDRVAIYGAAGNLAVGSVLTIWGQI